MYADFVWSRVAERRNRLTRQYEPIQPFLLLELARLAKTECFVDVGANIGVYAIFLSKVDTITRNVAFEPAPETFLQLQANIRDNGLEGLIETRNTAVSDHPGTVEFGVVKRFSGANSVVDTSIHDAEQFSNRISVESEKLDDIFTFEARQVCMKIDVEGHESAVISGGRSFLKANRCIVQMESYQDDSTAVDQLRDLGFRICFSVGPDIYLTNDDRLGGAETFLKVFEKAAAAMITSNLSGPSAPPKAQG